MNLDAWMFEVSKAYAAMGAELSPDKKQHLLEELPTTKTDERFQTIRETFDVLSRYFFQQASVGRLFGPVERVTSTFGRTIEQNYGLSDGPFINFAKTYWTYKLEVQDLFPQHSRISLSQTLLRVEETVASRFFPTPGPLSIPVDKRRAAQRELLEMYAPSMDIDRFLSESPVLRGNSGQGGGGCGVASLILLATVASVLASLWGVAGWVR